MGITNFSKSLIEKALQIKPDIKSVIELGSQNDYTTGEANPPFANNLYKQFGVSRYACIDLAGDNNSIKIDLSEAIPEFTKSEGGRPQYQHNSFDLVTDFGTSEHVVKMSEYESIPFHEGHINSIYPKGEVTEEQIAQGYYNCWLNKFNLCKVGGLIISENPLTGNWPEHGYSYLGVGFYDELCSMSDLEGIEQGFEAAMGNTQSGWNYWSVLKKTGSKFPPFEQFQTLPIFRK